MGPSSYTRRVRPPFALDLRLSFAPLRRGPHDPTMHVSQDLWRATRTPAGPVTLHLWFEGPDLVAEAWGPGADRALEALPSFIGWSDDPSALTPHHETVRALQARLTGLRIGRTGAVIEALVPAILEQKVIGLEAWRAYSGLAHRYGGPAPGPGGLMLPPDPNRLAGTPYYELHGLGIERRRAELIRFVCARSATLEADFAAAPADAATRLQKIPGIGPWTAAEVTGRALGDPDAVPVGDYHLPSIVVWALTGRRRGDDAQMLELLEPYRGQRGRVLRLLEAGVGGPPRRGPRMRLRSIARI